jgi:hypothetical protein
MQAVALQLKPIISDCVTSNAFSPLPLSRCLSKIIAPAFHGLSAIAVKAKEDFRRYEQQNSSFEAQLRECHLQLRESVARAETLVQAVRQCVYAWEQSGSAPDILH